MAIDVEQLAVELDEYGFVVVHNLIPSDVARRMATRLVEIMRKRPDAEKPDQALLGLFNHLRPDDYDLFVPLITDPVYRALARHALGDGFNITAGTGFWTKPGAPEQRLHVDVPLGWFARAGLPLPNVCLALNCVWMLTDFDRENGGTLLMPFSHHARRVPREGVAYRHLVAAEGPAGSIVIFNTAIWHGRGANASRDRERVGATCSHFATWVDPTTPAVNWHLMKRSVRDRLPPVVQEVTRHVAQG